MGGTGRPGGAEAAQGGRPQGTAIYYLLVAGERSHWHRVDAVETWHHYGGGPLELWISADGVERELQRAGHRPHGGGATAGPWSRRGRGRRPTPGGDYCLVGCTVVPGFDFAGFELAPPDWQPGRDS